MSESDSTAAVSVPQIPPRAKNRIGETFGRLTVITFDVARKRKTFWRCRCECGNEVVVVSYNLTSGHTTSCGCFAIDRRRKQLVTHGMTKSSVYNTWLHLRYKCYDPTRQDYARYGGRGIRVCERWLNSVEHFLEDMGPRPSPQHSIDRINNDGNYEPGNCRWATAKEQGRNRRTNTMLECRGKSQCIAAWAEEIGRSINLICDRLKRGWSVEDAIFKPVQGKPDVPVSSLPLPWASER